MSEHPSPSPYDAIPDFGVLYDSVPLYAARGDVSFYVKEAAGVEGPVLELGCGTGRILLPLAREGQAVVGLDSSEQMLARCRAKLRDETPDVRDRVVLYHGDVRSFALGRTYPLIIAPFRVMQQLVTIEDQIKIVDCVARHLMPGGRFIFDVFNPNFSALVRTDGVEREDTPEQSLPDGRSFRRTARVSRVRWVDQVSDIELIYYVSRIPGGAPERYVHAFEMRWYLFAELQHLLARCGFRVQWVYGDFERRALTDGSPEQVVCAVSSQA